MSDKARIIITNDDGVDSPGLQLLAIELDKHHEVIVAAPSTDRSGAGTGIGHFDPVNGVDLHRVDIGGPLAYSVDGPPGLAVLAAALGAFGDPPDLVVSGVNAGINTGHSVIHSGTVGGALTARTFGYDGLAVSLYPSDPWHWESAVSVAGSAVDWILRRPGEPIVLNVNVPAMPIEEVRGSHWADLDDFGYFRVATAEVEASKLQFQVGPGEETINPASDTALIRDGFVTVTPLSTVEPTPFPDIEASEIWSRSGD